MKLQWSLDEANAQSQKTINELNRAKIEIEMRLRSEIDALQRQNAEALAQRGKDHNQELTDLEQKLEAQHANEIKLINEGHRAKIKEFEKAIEQWEQAYNEANKSLDQKIIEMNEMSLQHQQLKQTENNLGGENGINFDFFC